MCTSAYPYLLQIGVGFLHNPFLYESYAGYYLDFDLSKRFIRITSFPTTVFLTLVSSSIPKLCR
ncbi:unknown protein [Microcystis aeruginosa NIES-843]|uniref:Uncharacterized protein n=1 Tax=Microcystis aeruginosa (strain NIES-843 / IAM M-2473) TaxID=449447 RepID=B0JVV9_MICAN|nr:unknown protein [Microcystis aeruginosa NIES-843]